MAGVNKAIIVGYLGADPEVRYTPSGTAVTTFSVATSETWKDKETGEKRERTEWHRITAFGRRGEVCAEYLAKGKQVYVEGKIRTEKWTDREGVERYTTKILADQVVFLGNSSNGAKRPSQSPSERPGQNYGYDGTPQYDPEDDIPF